MPAKLRTFFFLLSAVIVSTAMTLLLNVEHYEIDGGDSTLRSKSICCAALLFMIALNIILSSSKIIEKNILSKIIILCTTVINIGNTIYTLPLPIPFRTAIFVLMYTPVIAFINTPLAYILFPLFGERKYGYSIIVFSFICISNILLPAMNREIKYKKPF